MVVDPYEAAVISLPVAVKERLLRILRLGIATRFDVSSRVVSRRCTESIFFIIEMLV